MLFAVESAFEPLDDLISVGMISELLDWARLDPVLMRLADPSRTYLCGHSRVKLAASLAFLFVPYNGVDVIMLAFVHQCPSCSAAQALVLPQHPCDTVMFCEIMALNWPVGRVCRLHYCAYSDYTRTNERRAGS